MFEVTIKSKEFITFIIAIFLCLIITSIYQIQYITVLESSPDSCVKCYTMFLPFLLIKIDVFS